MKQINQADTVASVSHPLAGVQYLRKDEITEINQREQLLSIAPQAEAGLYLVPKVIEVCELGEGKYEE